jgi:hypothetical protein
MPYSLQSCDAPPRTIRIERGTEIYTLHYGRSTKPLLWVVPDQRWPQMWRIRWPDGRTSDRINLARAKDAAAAHAALGPPERDRRRFNWQIEPPETGTPAALDASNPPAAPGCPPPNKKSPRPDRRAAPAEAAE